MSDKISAERRSWNMSRIRSTDTKPELVLRSVLHRMGFRFRVHCRELAGKPDIVLPKYRTAILVHGCFWHQHPGCVEAVQPETNRDYWLAKLAGNVERDRKNRRTLERAGWRVLRYWECEIERDPVGIAERIARELGIKLADSVHDCIPSRATLLKAAERRASHRRNDRR